MATNKYMQSGRGIGNLSEKELLHNLITESIQFLGQDLYYIPRNIPNFDELFGEDPTSNFTDFAVIEMFMESFDGFDGKDDYMSRFGLRTQEEVVFRVSRRRFEEVIGSTFTRTLPNNDIRPNEGDLLYFAMDNNLFEIKNVSLKDSFYQLQDFYSYLLTCTLFQYSSEVIDTGVPEIQNAVPPSLDNLLYPFVASTENVLIEPTISELAGVNIGTTPLNQIDYSTSNKIIYNKNNEIENFNENNPFGLTTHDNEPTYEETMNRIDTTTINYNSSPSIALITAEIGTLINYIEIIVDVAFNGTLPTISIGTYSVVDKYMTVDDSDLTETYTYQLEPNLDPNSVENIVVTYTAGGSTEGSARILIHYNNLV